MLSSFERVVVAEAFTVVSMGAAPPRRNGEPQVVPPEPLEHVQTGHGGLAGTWEILTIPRTESGLTGVAGHRAKRPLAGDPGTRGCQERTQRCNRGTAKRRKRSAAGRSAGSLSALIVPRTAGTFRLTEDPAEGRGASDHGIVFGNYGGCIEIRTAYQRNRNG